MGWCDFLRQGHFVFWQQYVSTPHGQTFCQFYQVNKRPTVMILDADTRAQLKQWDGFVEPDVLLDQVTSFVEARENSNAAKKNRAAARAAAAANMLGGSNMLGGFPYSSAGGAAVSAAAGAGASVAAAAATTATGTGGAGGRAMTEEEEMEAAIRASMGGADDSMEAAIQASLGSGGGDEDGGGGGSSADTPAAAGARLGEEPAPDAPDVTTIMLRLPDGSQARRRFIASRSTQDVFDFLHSKGFDPAAHSVMLSFPRKEVTDASLSLKDAGLANCALNIQAK